MSPKKGFDENNYDRPTGTVLTEIRDLNREMSDLCLKFSALCDRMEACAKQVRDCSLKADRQLFQTFFDNGVAPGKFFRVLGSDDENAIFVVTGMDGSGIYFKSENGGREFHFDVYEHQDKARRLRMVPQRKLAASAATNNTTD